MTKLVFLGRLEDLAGARELSVPGADSLSALLGSLAATLPASLVEAVSSPKVRIAVNGALIGADQNFTDIMIADGDEIAFLPPVSGG